jgi:general secretion pathway protein A
LRDKLQQPHFRQLRQRITVRYHLGPLNLTETAYYIFHRLTLAGANGRPRFDEGAVKTIFKYSQGIPRLINAVCDKALLAGFVTHSDVLTKKTVRLAIDELQGVPA